MYLQTHVLVQVTPGQGQGVLLRVATQTPVKAGVLCFQYKTKAYDKRHKGAKLL